MFARRLAATLLVCLGLAGALAASHARRLGNELLGARVVIGQESSAAPDPGNDAAARPFAFGVVGPLRGSHAALERALRSVQEPGPVDFVVLLGDVTGTGSETEALRLVATWRAAGVERLAVPGAGDLEPERLAAFEGYVSPARWWFVRNECLFLGAPGDGAGDVEFLRKGVAAGPQQRVLAAFSSEPWAASAPPPRLHFAAAEFVAEDAVVAARVDVAASLETEQERFSVSDAPTLSSLRRDLEFGLLFPVVGEGVGGYAAVLGGCVLLVGCGFLLWRRRPPDAASASARD